MTIKFDETGLTTQNLEEIKTEVGAAYKEKSGAGFQLEDNTNTGKIIGLYADREAALQEGQDGVYLSQYLNSASGVSLDRVLERMGLQRQTAQPSIVIIDAAGTPGAAVTSESLRMSAAGTGAVFFNTENFTLGLLVDETIDSLTRVGNTVTAVIGGGHAFPLDSRVFMLGAEQPEYNGLQQITAVTPTSFDYILTGILPVTPATGTITAKEATAFEARSELEAPIQALAGSITTIVSAVSGISQVENADDAVLGRNVETDPEAKSRALESLGISGGSTQPSIIAKLKNIPGVIFATVFQNTTNFTDSNGLPSHSIRTIVDGGVDQDIWDVLYFEAVSSGIQMDGSEQTTITDANGEEQPVAFSRPVSVRIFVDAGNGLVTNTESAQGPVFPVDGNDQIKNNLTNIDFQLGGDVWPAVIKEAINKVDGVIASDPEFDILSPPVNKNIIPIAPAERADIDTDDISGL